MATNRIKWEEIKIENGRNNLLMIIGSKNIMEVNFKKSNCIENKENEFVYCPAMMCNQSK